MVVALRVPEEGAPAVFSQELPSSSAILGREPQIQSVKPQKQQSEKALSLKPSLLADV